MKRLALIVSLLTSMAHAGPRDVLPPVEYDRPYTGKLEITTMPQEIIRAMCIGVQFKGPALSCALRPVPGKCHILIAPEKDLTASGWEVYIVLRHEIGHATDGRQIIKAHSTRPKTTRRAQPRTSG